MSQLEFHVRVADFDRLYCALAGQLERIVRSEVPACDAVVAYLFRLGQVMPSLYLEYNGQLRCVAQRGLWQVLDGMPGTAGITGRTWATGQSIVVAGGELT